MELFLAQLAIFVLTLFFMRLFFWQAVSEVNTAFSETDLFLAKTVILRLIPACLISLALAVGFVAGAILRYDLL